jgi:hypothetical protein
MSLLERLANSFTAEFKRPATAAMCLAMVLFAGGGWLQYRFGWTTAARPVWVSVLWSFSPVSFFAPAYFPLRESARRTMARLAACLAVHITFVVAYCEIVRRGLQLSTPALLGLIVLELALLIFVSRKLFGQPANVSTQKVGF